MTTFDEREKSFEKKFAMDQELKFKAEARRNKLLGAVGGGEARADRAGVDDYVKAVRKADLAEKGDEDVFRKVRKDFDEKGVRVPSDRGDVAQGRWADYAWPTGGRSRSTDRDEGRVSADA